MQLTVRLSLLDECPDCKCGCCPYVFGRLNHSIGGTKSLKLQVKVEDVKYGSIFALRRKKKYEVSVQEI